MMVQVKLKDKLIEKLESIDDEILLQSVLNLIELETNDVDRVDFNDEQIQLIEDAKLSARSNGIPNQDVFSKTNEWLKK